MIDYALCFIEKEGYGDEEVMQNKDILDFDSCMEQKDSQITQNNKL
jgi:hypothetical protein